MQPTMKLRWKLEPSSASNDPQVLNGYGDRLVLQQWWEEEYETLYITSTGTAKTEREGEWRDVPIETD